MIRCLICPHCSQRDLYKILSMSISQPCLKLQNKFISYEPNYPLLHYCLSFSIGSFHQDKNFLASVVLIHKTYKQTNKLHASSYLSAATFIFFFFFISPKNHFQMFIIFCVFLNFQFLFMIDSKWPSKRYLPSNPWVLSLQM